MRLFFFVLSYLNFIPKRIHDALFFGDLPKKIQNLVYLFKQPNRHIHIDTVNHKHLK